MKRLLNICVIGKYSKFKDAYLSLIKSLENSAVEADENLKLNWIDSETLEQSESSNEFKESMLLLETCDGILVPGGFGSRGTEGKIKAVKYAR